MKPIPENLADSTNIPKDVLDQLAVKMSQVESALLAHDPEMRKHLKESHALLMTYPETVHLLEPSEVNTLLRAFETLRNQLVVKEISTGKSGRGKSSSLKNITADDL